MCTGSGSVRSPVEDVRGYHREVERAFSIATSGLSLRAGETTPLGVQTADVAREIILEHVLLPSNGMLVVAALDLVISPFFNDISQESNVYIEGIYFNLLPNGQPAYLAESGGGGVALWQAIGGAGDAQLSMNCGCAPVATEEATWGSVKSLYR